MLLVMVMVVFGLLFVARDGGCRYIFTKASKLVASKQASRVRLKVSFVPCTWLVVLVYCISSSLALERCKKLKNFDVLQYYLIRYDTTSNLLFVIVPSHDDSHYCTVHRNST